MSKLAKLIVGIISSALVVSILFIVFSFYGNPLSQYLVTKNAEEHIEENYKSTDYVIEAVNYDFKTGSYYVCVKSPTSPDSSFTLFAGTNGKITFDSYESNVSKKWNTAHRINNEYWDKTKSLFERDDFPYSQHIAFGEIIFKESDTPVGEDVPYYAVSTADLILDSIYDVNEFAKTAGKLTVYIYDNDISIKRLAEILLGIKDFLNDNGLAFYAIDCVLEYPRPENENEPWKEDRTEVKDFLYKDIYEEGLTERVSLANENAKNYWAEQDTLKDAEF